MRIYSKIFVLIVLLSGFTFAAANDPVRAQNGMVVSASGIASDVGIKILKNGGNAVDAAVATGFALAVTFPEAGNIGGGGFMVIHLANGKNTTIDYREKAPGAAHKDLFLDEDGNYDQSLSREGYTASGVPGSVDGMIHALKKYGTMSLAEVIQPAIDLARNGFEIEYGLAQSLNSKVDELSEYEATKRIYVSPNGLFSEGDTLIQKDLANTLEKIKNEGRDGFYTGRIAKLLSEQSLAGGGYFTVEDLAAYKSVEREPVYGFYKGYQIVSMGPPSSGGIAVIEALNTLERYEFSKEQWNSSEYIHTLVEILRRVYADRTKHLGDSDFYPVPVNWLTDRTRSDEIYNSIKDTATRSSQVNGSIPKRTESEETTHYSVIDKDGNMVSTTTTLNSSYGNKIVVDGAGFLLNNEMDDFAAKAWEPNQFGLIGSEANSIESGKRMLSSMTPTLILKDFKPHMVIGSPGGSTIITSVLQTIINVLDFKMNISEAIAAPKIHHQWMPDEIHYEEYGLADDVIKNLKERGHIFGRIRTLGRLEGILIEEDGTITGASDPRGYGKAAGY